MQTLQDVFFSTECCSDINSVCWCLSFLLQIGIIGGSGLDDPDILEGRTERYVDTPYGKVSEFVDQHFFETALQASFVSNIILDRSVDWSIILIFPNSHLMPWYWGRLKMWNVCSLQGKKGCFFMLYLKMWILHHLVEKNIKFTYLIYWSNWIVSCIIFQTV